jgi:hypothetical protein
MGLKDLVPESLLLKQSHIIIRDTITKNATFISRVFFTFTSIPSKPDSEAFHFEQKHPYE